MAVDISVIMTFHREGRIAHRTLKGLKRSIDFAEARGKNVEVIAVLDRVTDVILEQIIDDWKSELTGRFQDYKVDFGCPAQGRNYGIGRAKGKYISILDGDDLCSENWLFQSHEVCLENPNIIAHPEFSYCFGRDNYIWQHDKEPVFENLLERNIWLSPQMAPKKTFEKIPYRPRTEEYGREDWLWNCETLSSGYKHILVKDTLICARSKSLDESSLRMITTLQKKIVAPNKLFRDIFLMKYYNSSRYNTISPNYIENIALKTKKFVSKNNKKSNKYFFHSNNFLIEILNLIPKILKTIKNRLKGSQKKLPAWVFNELREIAKIEPLVGGFHAARVCQNPTTKLPRAITSNMSELVRHEKPKVFLLRALVKGGSELEAIHYMHALPPPVFFITTNDEPHPWKQYVPQQSIHIDIARANLNEREKILLLLRLLLEASPEFIHVINSSTAFDMFIQHPNLWKDTKIFTTFFCTDILPDGSEVGFALSRLPKLLDFFTGISCDNNAFKNRLIDLFGLPEDLIVAHRMPFSPVHFPMQHNGQKRRHTKATVVRENTMANDAPLRILFAGRLVFQKRPDLAYKVVKELREEGLNVEMDMWGSKVPGKINFSPPLSTSGAIRFRGEYNGLISIPLDRYDLMLHPSAWEGLPNVIIESMGNGLPVIAADVGGVGEIVTEETGWLIKNHDDPESYKEVIRNINRNRGIVEMKSSNARNFVLKKHSWENFRREARLFYKISSKEKK